MSALAEAKAVGLRAADRCAENAGDPWREDALQAVIDYAKRGKSFTTEDVRAAHPELGAHDDRAWGSIVKKAQRLGHIVAAGAVAVVSSRGGFKTLWRAT